MIESLGAAVAHYADQGFSALRYKAVPYIYQSTPGQDDLYALFRLGAARLRCDLSCAGRPTGGATPQRAPTACSEEGSPGRRHGEP